MGEAGVDDRGVGQSNDQMMCIIGGGNMGAALLAGIVGAGWAPSRITVVEVDAAKRARLSSDFGVGVSAEMVPCATAVIAVKPQDAPAACATAVDAGAGRVLSLAAGVTLETLSSACGGRAAVVRAMPNTPSLVGEGAAAISGSKECGDDDLAWAESVLAAVGTVVRVPESQMDAVTAVSGSGPGYLFLIAEALVAAAEAEGLPPEVADALVRQTLKGAGALLASSPEDAATLRARVTSPNGTTAAGLSILEARSLRAVIAEAVHAAAERSRAMARDSAPKSGN